MTNNKTGTEGLHSAGSCSIPKFWGPKPWVSMVLRHMKCWGPGFLRSHVTWNVDVLGFQGLAAYGCFKVLGFQGLATKMTMQGPGSIKVPDLGLCEPWISDLFGTLAQVWSRVTGYPAPFITDRPYPSLFNTPATGGWGTTEVKGDAARK